MCITNLNSLQYRIMDEYVLFLYEREDDIINVKTIITLNTLPQFVPWSFFVDVIQVQS